MRKPKIINYPHMKVIQRKDFYEGFNEQLKKITADTGAAYFGHNIIKNYRERGHTISTFCNYESWHDLYWDKYHDEDPMEKIVHHAVQKNNFGVVSWEIGQKASACGQKRRELTSLKDGIFFSFKKPENYFETFNIGWHNLNAEKLDIDHIFHLTSLLKPIRDHHWEVHDQI